MADISPEQFKSHLDRASAIVASWPEWKQNVFGAKQMILSDTDQSAEIAALKAEIARLHAFILSAAERLAACSEALGRCAERGK